MESGAGQDLDLGVGGEDPLAGVEADPSVGLPEEEQEEERLGGDGATLEDMQEPAEGEYMEEPPESDDEPEEPLTTDDQPAEPGPEPDEPAAEEPAEEPAAEAPEEPEAEPEPEPAPAADGKSPMRQYVILVKNKGGAWAIPDKLKKPVEGRNGDMALRTAYRTIADGEESMELAAVPTTYWNPKKVKGRKSESYAIDLNA